MQPDFPKQGVSLYIAGEPAYMMGERFAENLKRLASKLQRSQIYFVGHTAGARKKALFELIDLYVFPSKHESYGLTLLEALREGKPVLTTSTHGSREVFKSDFGEMIPACSENQAPALLLKSVKHLLSNRSKLKTMGDVASAWARHQSFPETAARLADLLQA